ncbi:TolC family protein, partial [uncultured Abyssibacter sp.]|uniref:TolC family protein n=1 Tax=uncultured Abyssibacter sp. TaxID=2320202 RepID=UPI0032B24977
NVVGARLQAELAQLAIRTNESSRLPQLDLTASYGRNDTSESRIGQDAEEARVGLNLTVPIFTGGANVARLDAARATYLQRAEELRAARELAEAEVRSAWRTVRASRRRIAARERAVQSTRTALVAVRDGYEVGTRTLSDVLAAEQAALRAVQEFNAARHDYVVAVVDLKLAAGTVTDADLPKVDAVFTGENSGSVQ